MKGKLSISRYSSNKPPNYGGIHIELTDVLSNVLVIDIDLTPEQFGNAISGLGYVDCEFELGRTEYVGLKREYKTELIKLDKNEFVVTNSKRQEELIAPYEIDGWKGKVSDLANHHNYDRESNSIRVRFTRFVKTGDNL